MEPISMDALPNELVDELSSYLSDDDLQAIRTVSHRWNETAKYKLRRRWGKRTFTLDTVPKLAIFNTTFANYEPKEDFASAKFCFKLAVLASDAASQHLNVFTETFGTVVNRLILNFSKPELQGTLGFMQEVKPVVYRNVAGLLSKVKGQLEKLRLQCYRGLCPSVIGPDVFPALRVLKIQNYILGEATEEADPAEARDEADPAEARDEADPAEAIQADLAEAIQADRAEAIQADPAEAIEADPAEGIEAERKRLSATGEGFVLALSEKVPALEQFSFVINGLPQDGDPAFLSKVLRNIARVNPEVSVKLALRASLQTVHPAFLAELLTVPVKITDLSLQVDTSDRTDEFRKLLQWISAQSDCLKTLTFYDSGERSHGLDGTDLQFPTLRILEKLTYFPLSAISLLPHDSAAHFPNLRCLRTVIYGNDFSAPLPTVTELVLLNIPGIGPVQGIDETEHLLKLAPFPNLTSLYCCDVFCYFASMRKLRNLTRLHLTPHSLSRTFRNFFWDCMTNKAPQLTFDEIVALPEPNAEIDYEDDFHFRGLESLKEFVVSLMGGTPEFGSNQLDTLVYISKTKRLQRLPKLVLESRQVPEKYLEVLRRYHDFVNVKRKDAVTMRAGYYEVR